ncbi:hypothetical protein IWX49DRAFT_13962 [Phyllosticta citricarpa]|uniref:Secreted protein n=1 Tax=Phyllosticta citricarpa TaxID=55181 RepID=A0ABR1MR08_9PEZI
MHANAFHTFFVAFWLFFIILHGHGAGSMPHCVLKLPVVPSLTSSAVSKIILTRIVPWGWKRRPDFDGGWSLLKR